MFFPKYLFHDGAAGISCFDLYSVFREYFKYLPQTINKWNSLNTLGHNPDRERQTCLSCQTNTFNVSFEFCWSVTTPCLNNPAESNLETFPVKMRPAKLLPREKGWDLASPECILYNLGQPGEMSEFLNLTPTSSGVTLVILFWSPTTGQWIFLVYVS